MVSVMFLTYLGNLATSNNACYQQKFEFAYE